MKSTGVSEQKERNNQLIRWCLVFESRDKLRRALGRMSRQRRRWSGGVSRWTQERESGIGVRGLKVASDGGLRGAMVQEWRPPETRKEAREREKRWAAREGQDEGRGVRGGGWKDAYQLLPIDRQFFFSCCILGALFLLSPSPSLSPSFRAPARLHSLFLSHRLVRSLIPLVASRSQPAPSRT